MLKIRNSFLIFSIDYESPKFPYGNDKWVIVFNFCRETIRKCTWTHFPAFMNGPNRGIRCTPTLTIGTWNDAAYSLEYIEGGKVD